MPTITLKVKPYVLRSFEELAQKRHLNVHDIEREALVTYLRITGQYEPYDNFDSRYTSEKVKIMQELKEHKTKIKKGHTRLEI